MTEQTLRLTVACDSRAPAIVRDALSRRPDLSSRLDDVMLIASELVTNSVLHSGCGEDQPIEVLVRVRSDRVLVCVRDPGVSGQIAQLRLDQAVGGWGLQIVDELAEHWGAERAAGRHHIWAEVALPSSA